MNNDLFYNNNTYSKFYLEFIDAINDPNNPKHHMALQHVNDVLIKMYTRSTLLGKSKSNYGISNVSFINFLALPIPYPKIQFERCKITSIIILRLIDILSQDKEFIISNFSPVTDEFVSNLFNVYKRVYLNDSNVKTSKIRCYLNRSDFMIDGNSQSSSDVCENCISIPCICNENEWPKLIETNCIAVSNTTHSFSFTRILHPHADQQSDITSSIAKFIDLAINKIDNFDIKSSCILVVYDKLDTVFDWGRVGSILEDEYNHTVFYYTILDLVKMYETGLLVFDSGELFIHKLETIYMIKFIYLRSGYIPQHIKGEIQWKIIEYLERCNAVKVPRIPTQLICSKLGQMIWSNKQFIDKLSNGFEPILYTKIDQYDPAIDNEMRKIAINEPYKFVLKNHLEGGHGIFFNEEISEKLKGDISINEYVLSRRIFPPLQKAVFVNSNGDNLKCWVDNAVNELGIYSFGIFIDDENPIIDTPGYLSRTKSPNITGGGICSGLGNLSSLRII